MSKLQKGKNFEHGAVPKTETIGTAHIATIIIGGTISVPGFLMASQVSQKAGFYPAIMGFVIGCAVLGILGVFTGLVGSRSRLSTYLIMRHAFGPMGFRIGALITASVSLFWFAIIGNLFGHAMTSVFDMILGVTIDARLFSILGGILMTGIALYGIATLDKMARILVPIMAILLLYGAWQALGNYDTSLLSLPGVGTLGIGGAASVVIGAYSGGIVTIPDYTRYAKGHKGPAIAIFFALGVSFPLVLTITAIPSILSGQEDLINIMLFLGIGVGALIILIFSTISSNSLMLYSAGLGLSSFSNRLRFWKVTAFIGAGATILSTLDVVNLFVPYIGLLAISIPSLCGIYVCDFFLIKRGDYKAEDLEHMPKYNIRAFIAWAVGIMTGLASTYYNLGLTGIPALDSMIPAFLSYWLIAGVLTRKPVTQ